MQWILSSALKTATLSLLICGASPVVYAQSFPIEGVWTTEKGDSKIQFHKSGGFYSAKLIWFAPKNGEGMETRKDKHNPNEALRTRPLLGINIITGLRHAEKNDYEDGKAYDPSSGKTYSCKVTVNSNKQLTMRGFVGFSLIGKSVIWKRVSN